jgi:hypothetical protein
MAAAKKEEAVNGELVLYNRDLFPQLLDMDPREVRRRFAERFMKAENLDDLFNVLSGNTSQDMIGRTIQIRDVSWAPYESDAGIIPLAVCQAADVHTGEAFEFATTGEVLCMFIRRAELVGAIPFEARIAGKKTNSGQTALNFERP